MDVDHLRSYMYNPHGRIYIGLIIVEYVLVNSSDMVKFRFYMKPYFVESILTTCLLKKRLFFVCGNCLW